MGRKTFILLASCFFAVAAALHLSRLVTGSPTIELGAWTVPIWFSWGGFPVASALCLWGISLFRREGG